MIENQSALSLSQISPLFVEELHLKFGLHWKPYSATMHAGPTGTATMPDATTFDGMVVATISNVRNSF